MPNDKIDTQAQRLPAGKPESEGLANSPQDTATGKVRPQDGPMERAGTEAEAAARGESGPFEGAKNKA
jgi:hypothetical protein